MFEPNLPVDEGGILEHFHQFRYRTGLGDSGFAGSNQGNVGKDSAYCFVQLCILVVIFQRIDKNWDDSVVFALTPLSLDDGAS